MVVSIVLTNGDIFAPQEWKITERRFEKHFEVGKRFFVGVGTNGAKVCVWCRSDFFDQVHDLVPFS